MSLSFESFQTRAGQSEARGFRISLRTPALAVPLSSDIEHSSLSITLLEPLPLTLNFPRIAASSAAVSALVQAGDRPAKLADFSLSNLHWQRQPGRPLEMGKRASWPLRIVNLDSSLQVRDVDRAICAVTGHRTQPRSCIPLGASRFTVRSRQRFVSRSSWKRTG